MKTELTPRLLGFLIKNEYKYFLSQTTRTDQESVRVCITLKPVKKHPLLQKLPQPFNAYHNIIHGLVQMGARMNDTEILVELDAKRAERFENYSK
ncbi:hypothetical protein [Mucilaginibacter sp.]|uniref:hypothetical protein n=1 Tax=Mucilaginibacter sp. TaxID=1882438 RepID=UPI003B001014